jgi:glycerol-3-phosphate dehydrogenase
VRYAVTHEWARTVDDVIQRRTTCFVRGLGDDPTRNQVERLLADTLVG